MTQAKVELGRKLFFDKNLSGNQTQSCESCHIQKFAFADPRSVSIGSTGEEHRRNAPALVNIAYNKTLTWAHNNIKDIETQLLLPMFGEEPIELGITGNEEIVLQRFNNENYHALFEKAFGEREPSWPNIVKALASFVRSLTSLNSPFDRYAYDMDDSALTESQIRGMTLFFSEKLECHHCHGGFNFTQSTFNDYNRDIHTSGDDHFDEAHATNFLKLSLTFVAELAKGEVDGYISESTISLVSSNSSVNEGEELTIAIERVGDLNTEASVDYSTINGTAIAGIDFEESSGTVSWQKHEQGEKFIIVNILNVDSNKSFDLRLSNAAGNATLGDKQSITIEIVDSANSTPAKKSGGGVLGVLILLLSFRLLFYRMVSK